jgi:transcriptional regulator with XRE-family HTH domain
MERQPQARARARYNRKKMPRTKVPHPLDAALRKHVRDLNPYQNGIAERIGRSQSWLNKYLNGAGKATIDDVIRLVAVVVLGVDGTPSLTAEQRKLLRDWEGLPSEGRRAVKSVLAIWNMRRREQHSKSSARAEQKNHGTTGRSPGTR